MKAYKKLFFYPSLCHELLPSNSTSENPPNILPVVSFTIVTVFPFLQHLPKKSYPLNPSLDPLINNFNLGR